MVTEDYVSFETAKLLKEKGFDSECDYLYVNGGIVRAQGGKCNWNKGETIFTDYKNECSAPTLQMAMKWLREVHRRIISPKYNEVKDERGLLYSMWFFDILPISKTLPIIEYNQSYDSYEQACEAAIKYCLENLI